MGAFLDKYNESSEITQGSEECTPTKVSKLLQHRRLMTLDPRSPTEGITRTPIIVDKTPVPTISKTHVYVTADDTPRILRNRDSKIDPRSPSNDFTRTPIYPLGLPGSRIISPLAAQAHSPTSPLSALNDTESGIESAQVSPAGSLRKNIDAHSPDSALSFNSWGQPHNGKQLALDQLDVEVDDEMYVDDEDDISPWESTTSSSLSVHSMGSLGEISPGPVTSPTMDYVITPKLPVSCLTPDLSSAGPQGRINKKPQIWSDGFIRSPLTSVDNSRSLMHRVNAMPSGGKQLSKHPSAEDKENVFH